jgi:hypothetical protein
MVMLGLYRLLHTEVVGGKGWFGVARQHVFMAYFNSEHRTANAFPMFAFYTELAF